MEGNQEQLARLVHGAVSYGASAEDALRFSRGSVAVLRLALTYVDPHGPTADVRWTEVVSVIERAIALAEDLDG